MPLSVGQNFLTGTRTIARLLNATTITPADRVIEIGPGKGHITRALAPRCANLTAVELDPRLCAALREKLCAAPNVQLIQGDFLRHPLPESGAYKVFGNIPFSRTTDIVRRLTECKNPPTDAWLILERGAAMRFAGLPRESLRSLVLRPLFEVRIVEPVRRGEFHPMPAVDAALVHIGKKSEPDLTRGQMPAYEKFVRRAMERGLSGLLSRRQIQRALHRAGQGDGRPCAEMLYIQWLCLFRCYAGLDRR